MSGPTPAQVADYVEQLRKMARKGAKGAEAPLDGLERRLVRALERNRSGRAEIDGYPASTLGGGRGGGADVKLTPVEAAASGRIRGGIADPVDLHTRKAADFLEQGLMSLRAALGQLDALDALTGDTGEPAPRTCAWCAGKRGKGNDRPVAHSRATVGDRLGVAVDLCDPCWRFVEKTAPSGSRDGYLPSDRQIRDHEERGRWRIRTEARA